MSTLSTSWMITLYVASMVLILLIVVAIVANKMVERTKLKRAFDKKNKEQTQEGVSGAESAAIAMALHLYYGVHDEESNVITIKKNINNRYSPWSSKIYGLQ